MCCPGTDNGFRLEKGGTRGRVRQGDGDVVCPSVLSFNLEGVGGDSYSRVCFAHAEARRVIGGVCPIGTSLVYKVN